MNRIFVLLGVVCLFDYRLRKIPNLLILILAAYIGYLRWESEGAGGLCQMATVAILIITLLFPLFRLGMLGAGDLKLLGIVSAYYPLTRIPVFLVISLFFAGLFSLLFLLAHKNFRQRFTVLSGYIYGTALTRKVEMYPQGDCSGTIPLSGPILLGAILTSGGIV